MRKSITSRTAEIAWDESIDHMGRIACANVTFDGTPALDDGDTPSTFPAGTSVQDIAVGLSTDVFDYIAQALRIARER